MDKIKEMALAAYPETLIPVPNNDGSPSDYNIDANLDSRCGYIRGANDMLASVITYLKAYTNLFEEFYVELEKAMKGE